MSLSLADDEILYQRRSLGGGYSGRARLTFTSYHSVSIEKYPSGEPLVQTDDIDGNVTRLLVRQPVWRDGEFVRRWTFDEVRARARA